MSDVLKPSPRFALDPFLVSSPHGFDSRAGSRVTTHLDLGRICVIPNGDASPSIFDLFFFFKSEMRMTLTTTTLGTIGALCAMVVVGME